MNHIKKEAVVQGQAPVGNLRGAVSVWVVVFFLAVSGCAHTKGSLDPGSDIVHAGIADQERHGRPAGTGLGAGEGERPVVAPSRQHRQTGEDATRETSRKTASASDGRAGHRVIDTPFGMIHVKPDTSDGAVTIGAEARKTASFGGYASRTTDADADQAHRTEEQKNSDRSTQSVSIKAEASKTEKTGVGKDDGEQKTRAGDLVLNFEDADLGEVVRIFAELLQINYIADANMRGKVTIHTAGSLGRENLFPVFFQILEINGLTAVPEDGLYRILRSKDAPQFTSRFQMGVESADIPPGERVIIQIVPLKYIAVQEMTKLLTPFMSAGGTLLTHEESNIVILVDKSGAIAKALKMVEAFDIDVFQRVNHQVFPLRYVDVEETAKVLNDLLATYTGTRKTDTKIISLSRLNALLIVSRDQRVFAKVDEFLPLFDVPSESMDPQIYVYHVKNGQAEDIAGLLNQVFGAAGTRDKVGAVNPRESREDAPAAEEQRSILPFETAAEKARRQPSEAAGPSLESFGSGTLRADVKIIPDPIRNALIIEALPSDYRIVTGILKSIDVLPRQVLIEVTVAEISLDDSTSMGVEWSFLKDMGGIKGFLNASLGEKGVSYTLGLSEEWTNALSALAKREKVNILSSPSLLASDNKEASINISTQVPVASAEYRYTTGQEGMLQTNIQYRNTGVILSVTPHINDRGLVSMDIRQEVSEQGQGVDVGGRNYPSFRERSVATTLTVNNGQTIVIGGLIRETRGDTMIGLPFLSRLPIIGWLFGKVGDSVSKSELIIMITPHVIATLEDVDDVTREFKNKVHRAVHNIR